VTALLRPRTGERSRNPSRRNVAEFSIRDAGHDDAQYPSEAALRNNGIDPGVSEPAQITFTAALTAAAISLAATGSLDYAWSSYSAAFDSGRFVDAKRK
jgi:hypothetical protein